MIRSQGNGARNGEDRERELQGDKKKTRREKDGRDWKVERHRDGERRGRIGRRERSQDTRETE